MRSSFRKLDLHRRPPFKSDHLLSSFPRSLCSHHLLPPLQSPHHSPSSLWGHRFLTRRLLRRLCRRPRRTGGRALRAGLTSRHLNLTNESLRIARDPGRLAARTRACLHHLATRARRRHRRRRHHHPVRVERCFSHRFHDGFITPRPVYTLVPVGRGKRCSPQWQCNDRPIYRNRRALCHPPRRPRRRRRCCHAPRSRPSRPSLPWAASGQKGLWPPLPPPPRPPRITRTLCLLRRRRRQWRRASHVGGRLLSSSGSWRWRPERRPSGGWRTPQPLCRG